MRNLKGFLFFLYKNVFNEKNMCYNGCRREEEGSLRHGLFSNHCSDFDFFLKKYIDKKYARKVKNPRLGGMICIEKFYNKGATLNLLAKHPKAMTVIHSVIMVFVAVIYYFAMRMTGKELKKTGLAMLAGGGLSNLYDRYTKHHVVDYVRFQTGPKWFRRIIFNVSDFFIFIGAVLAVIGSEV